MGTGASVSRERNLQRLLEREVTTRKDQDESLSKFELQHHENISKLQTTLSEMKQRLKETEKELEVSQRKLEKSQKKITSLMYNELPMAIMKETLADKQLAKTYPMITVAYCFVVNFSTLTTILKPQDTVSVIDQLQAAIDEAFTHNDIFIMERRTNGCIAVSGLVECEVTNMKKTNDLVRDTFIRTETPLSYADSSYGSEVGLQANSERTRTPATRSVENKSTNNCPSLFHAGLLARSVLKFMSLSTDIHIPAKEHEQLQIRIAMNSGPCDAGIINLQTAVGIMRIPHYKLFGPTIHDTAKLCSSSLALQIRVSKQCHKLLVDVGGFKFERCPDFISSTASTGKHVESYWLIGAENFNYSLPSLDLAISLSDYDDLIVCN